VSGLVISPAAWRSAKQIYDMTKGTNLVIVNTDKRSFCFHAKLLRDFMLAGLHAGQIEYQMDIEEEAEFKGPYSYDRNAVKDALVIRYRSKGMKGQARFAAGGGVENISAAKQAKLCEKEPLRLWFKAKEEPSTPEDRSTLPPYRVLYFEKWGSWDVVNPVYMSLASCKTKEEAELEMERLIEKDRVANAAAVAEKPKAKPKKAAKPARESKETVLYSEGGKAGCVSTVRNRRSGTFVSVYNAEQAGIDASDGAWASVCEDHGTICNHKTMKFAFVHSRVPEWCSECQDVMRKEESAVEA